MIEPDEAETFSSNAYSHSGAGLLFGLIYQTFLLIVILCLQWSPNTEYEFRYVSFGEFKFDVTPYLSWIWSLPVLCFVLGLLLSFLRPIKRIHSAWMCRKSWIVSFLLIILNMLLITVNRVIEK